jgi:alcohol dehydrogenase class IV
MAVNVGALQERAAESEALRRYDEIARILTGNGSFTADDGVGWVQDLCDAVQVPSLGSYGITSDDFQALVDKASAASSMRGNPIQLTPGEMEGVLSRAL